ncbi:MAG: glycosyltransferase [Candidatus Paceibacterota bacterium]
MKISIIIPCLNEAQFLPDLIRDIKNQTHLPEEVLVIDAQSTDETLLKTEEVGLVQLQVISTNPNIGAQRKLGGDSTAGDLLVFLDADTRISPDFLDSVVSVMTRGRLDIACPSYVPYAKNTDGKLMQSTAMIRFIYRCFDVLFFCFQKISPSGAGSCICVKKYVYTQTGGFRTDLKFDDIEFIRRASRVGKFGKLTTKVQVSDRRFVRYGVLHSVLVYFILSIFFLFSAYKAAEVVQYSFADYGKR